MPQYLETDTEGRTIFYPWNEIGPGYYLPDERQRGQARRLINQGTTGSVLLALGAMLAIGKVLPPGSFFALPALLILWYVAASRSLVRGLSVARERPLFRDYCAESSDKVSFLLLLTIFICHFLFAWAFGWYSSRSNFAVGVSGSVMFGTLASFCAYMLRVKWDRTRQKKQAAKLREPAR